MRSNLVMLKMLVVVALFASTAVASEARAQEEHESRAEEAREEVHAVRWGRPRLRLGFSGIGGGFVGAVHGGAGGLAVRVGVQLNDVVALYIQSQGVVAELYPDPHPTGVLGFMYHALMLDITLLDTLQFGAGPSIDFIWGCNDTNGGTACGRAGAFFGGDFRLALVLGSHGPGRRAGFVLSVDAHPTFLDHDFATMLLFGLGGELF